MRYLGLALVSEGSSDLRFLPNILRRTTEELCLQHASEIIEVGDVLSLPRRKEEKGWVDQVSEAAGPFQEAFGILFIHTDGGNDHQEAIHSRVTPIREKLILMIGQDYEKYQQVVGVVPVREMEAWAIADGDALRSAFGSRRTDQDLGIPLWPRDAEKDPDPKRTLKQAYEAAAGRSRSRRVASALDVISERVRLEHLRMLPAFQRFEDELRAALDSLGLFAAS
jgi:hypothetical protein